MQWSCSEYISSGIGSNFKLRHYRRFRTIAKYTKPPYNEIVVSGSAVMLGPVALTAVVDSALLRSRIRPSETPFLVLNLYSTSARFTNCRPLAPGSFRMYWRLISRVRRQVGRKQTPREVRELIFRMVAENPTWGAPRIHGELLMLGFDLSERTISRWMKRAPRDPERGKRWLAFLRNHREAIAAMDFFTVPTITFGVLYCFFVISHDRRRILHVNARPAGPHGCAE